LLLYVVHIGEKYKVIETIARHLKRHDHQTYNPNRHNVDDLYDQQNIQKFFAAFHAGDTREKDLFTDLTGF